MLQVQSYSTLFKVLNVTGAPVTGVFFFGHISETKHDTRSELHLCRCKFILPVKYINVQQVCAFLTAVTGDIQSVLWNYALKMLLFASPN